MQFVRRLEEFILEKMSQTKIPGIGLGLLKNEELIYSRGFGFSDVDSANPITPKTLFHIGSVTKSFTAFSIMKLYENGKLSLDDPVNKYLPIDLKAKGEPITLHHLLTHSSGIPALAYAEAFIRGYFEVSDNWLPISNPEDVISFMKDYEDWVVSKPGERFFYLNEGYVLLGLIISKVSGMDYKEFVKKEIFKPLEMERTMFCDEKILKEKDVATHYVHDKNGNLVPRRPILGITADGGIVSCVEDLSKYISMMANRGVYKNKRILEEKNIELMEKCHIELPYKTFGNDAYGYGWMIHPNFFNKKLVGHGGSVLTHNTYVAYIPEEKIGTIVLSNVAGYSPSYMGLYALSLLLDIDPGKLPFLKYENSLKKLQGRYETYKGTMKYDVVKKGDHLFVEHRDRFSEFSIPLFFEKEEDNTFVFSTISSGRKIKVEFKVDEAGTWMLMERYRFKKV